MNTKSNFNFTINLLMFLSLAFLSGMGFLLKYSGSIIKTMSLQGVSASVTFLGLKPRQWGHIHFIVSIIFLILLLIHIMFHWNWIVCTYKNMIKNKFISFIIALMLIIISIALFIFPFVIKPEITIREASSCSGSMCTTCATRK